MIKGPAPRRFFHPEEKSGGSRKANRRRDVAKKVQSVRVDEKGRMDMMKKIWALVLAVVMVMTLNATVFADGKTLDTNGEQGVFASKDTPAIQNKTLVLEKEIKVYNLDEASIKAPTISYTYSINAATVTSGTSVTDSDKNGTIHEAGVSVTVPVKAGVGIPIIANSGVVAWTAEEDVDAGTDGESNVKDIAIDFSSVAFTGPGVYRYIITEELTSGYAYNTSGVTETTAPATGAHTRFVDVYVKPSANYTDGTHNTDWDIYGFTCFYNNTSITEEDKTTVAVKTTGFVDGTTDGSTAFLADQYYTYNLTISKTVVNDGYGAATVEFPFTVLFTNENVSAGTIVTNGATTPTGTDFTHNTSVNLTTGALKGVAKLKSGQQIKYVGIPNGTSVEVFETNVANGVTYKVDTNKDGTTTTDAAVISGDAPENATHQTEKASYESTASVLTTEANEDDNTAHSIAVTNTLLLISPTGVVLRVAPYVMILVAGIAMLILAKKRKPAKDEE